MASRLLSLSTALMTVAAPLQAQVIDRAPYGQEGTPRMACDEMLQHYNDLDGLKKGLTKAQAELGQLNAELANPGSMNAYANMVLQFFLPLKTAQVAAMERQVKAMETQGFEAAKIACEFQETSRT